MPESRFQGGFTIVVIFGDAPKLLEGCGDWWKWVEGCQEGGAYT